MSTRTKQPLILAALICLGSVAMAQQTPGGAASNPAATDTSPRKPGTRAPLGDLTAFRTIAADTLRIVDTGDFAAAKKRIKDLEVSWDQVEPRMKPLAPQQWETVDVAIDRALKEVRAWSSTKAKSAEALRALIATMDALR